MIIEKSIKETNIGDLDLKSKVQEKILKVQKIEIFKIEQGSTGLKDDENISRNSEISKSPAFDSGKAEWEILKIVNLESSEDEEQKVSCNLKFKEIAPKKAETDLDVLNVLTDSAKDILNEESNEASKPREKETKIPDEIIRKNPVDEMLVEDLN
jgi:hypothetical protein